MLRLTPSATPFARWTFHRAWWDAYAGTAEPHYLLAEEPDGQLRAIIPLMRRRDDGDRFFFGASYHADYATILTDPSDLPIVSQELSHSLASQTPEPDQGAWDVVDLRRLRFDDPALPALEAAFMAGPPGWGVTRETEDVCPVVTVADGDWDAYLATLDKKDRHEIRRKLRRANLVGELKIELTPPTPAVMDEFIGLHNARWGEHGLFPASAAGERTRVFVQRLAELELSEPDGGQMHVALVRCAERLVFALVAFDDGDTCFMYNAGMDPAALDVSPGVTGTALYLRDRMAAGRRRFDFLRGDERYKYQWGALDEPIERLSIRRAERT